MQNAKKKLKTHVRFYLIFNEFKQPSYLFCNNTLKNITKSPSFPLISSSNYVDHSGIPSMQHFFFLSVCCMCCFYSDGGKIV